ncbi:hypothetical protein ACLOJK_031300 [Asimina triloba]
MEKTSGLFFFCLCVILSLGVKEVQAGSGDEGQHRRRIGRIRKLFVFGDSYADTGNIRKPVGDSWKVPYGITFPGKPSGRFSDGRVMTDFLAFYMGIRTPIPYQREDLGPRVRRFGINFAYGGAGVFDTVFGFPNLTTQIDFFHQLLHQGLYTKQDIKKSLAFVSIVGNDYTTYEVRNGSIEGAPIFVGSVVREIAANIKRLSDLGFRRIAVNGLQPIGCLPDATRSSGYKNCNATSNRLATLHNGLLRLSVKQLNGNENGSRIVIFDLFDAFNSILKNPGTWKFENPLTPCCMGVTSAFTCGSVDGNGKKLYTECQEPRTALFWDGVHPTQMGWAAISSYVKSTLYDIISS